MEPDNVSQFANLGISGLSPIQSRYSGSSPFQDDDISRILFFGRSTEAEALLHKILVEDLVVLYSRSGLGKTSLLNAGILKPLRERGFFPMICRVYVGNGSHQSDPLESIYVSIEQSIAKALRNNILGEYREGKKTTLWEYFKTSEIWSPDDILLTPVLILDQFEELFTLHERDKRQAFIEQLGDLVRGSIPKSLWDRHLQPAEAKTDFHYSEAPPKVKILISMREEYLGRLAEMAQDLPSIRKSEFRLTPLQRENAERAIVEPAQVDESRILEIAQKGHLDIRITKPFSYDAEKLREILDFLSNPEESSEGIEQNEVDPTQLQILCQYIEEKIRARLTQEPGKEVVVDNKLLPGKNEMRAAIQNFYDRAIERVQPRSNRRNVLALIENGLISRENRRLSLAQGDIQHRFLVSSETLQDLAKIRLLRPDYRLGDTYYELSHDTLIKPIQQSKENRRSKQKKTLFTVLSIVVAFLGIGTFYLTTIKTMEKVDVLQSKVDNLQQQKQDLGQIIQDTATSFTKRALDYQAMGDYQNAVLLFKEALNIREKTHGHESSETVTSMNNLARVYQAMGDYQKALPLFQEALSIREKTLGQESPDTTDSLKNLVSLYQAMGDNDQAQFLIQRAKIAQSLRKYLSLLSDKKVDEAIGYGAGDNREMLEDMAAGTEYYELKGIELNSSDLKKDLVQASINVVGKKYDKPPWSFSGTVVFKKENAEWKITELDCEPGGQWPWTSQRLIGKKDLLPFSLAKLDLMRNEIYARHGWVFKRSDLQDHFNKEPWYYPRGDQSNRDQVNHQAEKKLTPLENQNIQTIVSREKELKGSSPPD